MLVRPRIFAHVTAAVFAFCVASLSAPVIAQTISKPARILVGFAPGGSVDIFARLIAEKIRGEYAPNLVVENRPGAGGQLAVEALKNSVPDGSTMLLTSPGVMVINPHIDRKLSYDPLRDFAPVTTITESFFALAIGNRVPASVRNMADFIRWCRENPKEAAYGSPGPGTPPHFLGMMLSKAAGVELTHVPYKGMAPLVQDIIGGQIAAGIVSIGDAIVHAKDPKMRSIATTASARSRFLPDVPTAREVGYDVLEYGEWMGFFVPAGTPPELTEKLNAAIRGTLQAPDVVNVFAQRGLEIRTMSPTEFNAVVRSDYARWGSIVKTSGFRPDQ